MSTPTIEHKSSLKKVFKLMGVNSTFDGVAKIVRAERLPLRVHWTLVLLCLIGACSYVLIHAMLEYLAYEIVTTIKVRREIPAKMPAILVCNSNSLMTPTAINFASQVYSVYDIPVSNNYLNLTYRQHAYAGTINNKANILTPRCMVMAASREPSLGSDFSVKLGLTMHDMLLSCTFNSEECTADDFIYMYVPYYGNCYRFNSSGRGQISQTGKFHGLNMELFVGQAQTVEQVAQDSGLHIYVYNETTTPNPFSNSVSAPANKETTILVEKKRINKMEKPYGDCTPGLTSIDAYPSELYRLTFAIYGTYRQSDCFNTCFQKSSIDVAGCYCDMLPFLSNTTERACLSGIELFQNLAYFTYFFLELFVGKCLDCPLECDSEYYKLTSSSLAYPTQIYADILANQSQIQSRFGNTRPTYEQLKQSLASVNINYDQLGYMQLREYQKMTILDLVTSIGGTLGLFLGLSFLSLFEIVELVCELVCLLIEKCVYFYFETR